MIDNHGRNLHYLRVSLTDRCNLRCRYCMPEAGVPLIPHDEILRFDEILRLIRIMAGLGVDRVRLTGGEPLVRKGVAQLAADIRQIDSVKFLGLTTNGVLLAPMAKELFDAGVNGLNISIDTLDEARYGYFTRKNELPAVLAGLDKALSLPFQSVRVNCVLAKDAADSDWLSVVGLAKTRPVDVRLIEWMPMGGEGDGHTVSADEALEKIEAAYGKVTPFAAATRDEAAGPAQYYSVKGFTGRVGIIPAMTHNFCSACNRLRLTATGDLKLCLFYENGIPLKPLLRGGASDDEIRGAIAAAALQKPERHQGARKQSADGDGPLLSDTPCGMSMIGG